MLFIFTLVFPKLALVLHLYDTFLVLSARVR